MSTGALQSHRHSSTLRELRIYLRQVQMAIYDLWVYKWFFFGDLIRLPVTISLHVLIYLFIYSSGTVINTYTPQEGVSYILLVSLISRSFSQRGIATIMEQKILSGDLVQELSIPVRISFYIFSRRLGYPTYLLFVSILAYGLAGAFFPTWIVIPSFFRILLTIFFVICGMFIQMQVYYIIGLLTFWLKSIGFIAVIVRNIQSLIGGRYFPLTWLPGLVATVVIYLPFAQIYYIPALIFLSKETTVLALLLMQLIIWLVFLQICIELIERRGLQQFDGEGG